MDFFETLHVLRRRWLLIVVATIAGVGAGWATAPGDGGPPTYQATHTLIAEPSGNVRPNLEQVALLATTGDVPERVATRLDLAIQEFAERVTASADLPVQVIRITARSADPAQAEELANTTAEELLDELSGGALDAYQDEQARLVARVGAARLRVAELEEAVGPDSPDPVAAAEYQAAQSQLESALRSLEDLSAQGSPEAPMATVDEASAREVEPEGVRAPDSKPARAALLGAFGLLLGVGGAFALDRIDTRIHSKRTAEAAFAYPVIAEIPPLPRRTAGELLALSRPASPFVEAYRGLRTMVALWASGEEGTQRHKIIVVTSPMAGEGKTTSVAHLAAMLAEAGRTVLVVSADFRRPRLHLYFDREREPGLTEVLGGAPGAPGLGDLDLRTSLDGVRFVASGAPVENPAPMLEHAGDLLRAAKELCDIVLVDTPPLLVANDAAALAQEADGVLVLARAGRTTIEAAERTAEILRRLEVPVVGVVLASAGDTPSAYRYYRYRYYSETEKPRRRLLPFRLRQAQQASGNGRSATEVEAPSSAGRAKER